MTRHKIVNKFVEETKDQIARFSAGCFMGNICDAPSEDQLIELAIFLLEKTPTQMVLADGTPDAGVSNEQREVAQEVRDIWGWHRKPR